MAFTVGDKTSTVIETGLYNLTKDEAPVLIHFGQDRTEQWLLVRLKNPDATPAAPAAPTAPAEWCCGSAPPNFRPTSHFEFAPC